jgi:MAGE family
VQLRGYLKSLRFPPNAKLPFKTQMVESLKTPASIETFLSNMVRQGYLDKIKSSAPGSQVPKNKRPRGSTGNENKENHSWKWGLRAIEEIGEEGIMDFITTFMVEKHELIEVVEDCEDGSLDNAAHYHARKEEEATAMKRSIMKAALTQPAE